MHNYTNKVYTWLYQQFSNKPDEKRREDTDSRTLDLVARLKLLKELEKDKDNFNN